MPTTRLELPYPDLSDSADVPSDVQALAEAIDNAAMWDVGSYASRPATGDVPYGSFYMQNDAGGGYDAYTLSANTSAGWKYVTTLTTNQLAAIAGSAGTPSASNPFLTEDDTEVMHRDKARTITATHLFAAGPQFAVQTFAASGTVSTSGGRIVTFSGSASQTIGLPAATAGMQYEIYNLDSADSVTIDPDGSETIGGAATLTLDPGYRALVTCTSTGVWQVILDGGPATAVPVGASFDIIVPTVPDGYLAMTGQQVTSSYPRLRALLVAAGSPHGTSGGNPLLPDSRGRGSIGDGTGSGLTARTVGDTGGEETHLLTGAESGVKAHAHTASFSGSAGTTGTENTNHSHNGGTRNGASGSDFTALTTNAGGLGAQLNNVNHTHGFTPAGTVTVDNASAANASNAHNNMQPFYVATKMVKY